MLVCAPGLRPRLRRPLPPCSPGTRRPLTHPPTARPRPPRPPAGRTPRPRSAPSRTARGPRCRSPAEEARGSHGPRGAAAPWGSRHTHPEQRGLLSLLVVQVLLDVEEGVEEDAGELAALQVAQRDPPCGRGGRRPRMRVRGWCQRARGTRRCKPALVPLFPWTDTWGRGTEPSTGGPCVS